MSADGASVQLSYFALDWAQGKFVERLQDEADKEKVTTEAFDREEMPESGIATGALATEVEDMIGMEGATDHVYELFNLEWFFNDLI